MTSEPTTAAGRALLNDPPWYLHIEGVAGRTEFVVLIKKIEAEARATADAALAAEKERVARLEKALEHSREHGAFGSGCNYDLAETADAAPAEPKP